MSTAVVVGGGPNGLAAAHSSPRGCARSLCSEAAEVVGGGTRSSDPLMPGLLQDECSAVHMMAVGHRCWPSSTWPR